MSIVETFTQISQTISKIMNSIIDYPELESDVHNFLSEIDKEVDISELDSEGILLNFILSGRVGEKRQKFCEYYIEKSSQLTDDEKELITALSNSITSFFEIKKIQRNNFLLYNIANEVEYEAFPLVKMTHFRGMYQGQFLLATIIFYKGEYFLIDIKNEYSRNEKSNIARQTIALILSHPEIAYHGNSKKEAEIAEFVKNSKQKFLECFGCEEIITTGEDADILIELFDSYCQSKVTVEDCKEAVTKITTPVEYKFFDINDISMRSENFIEKSLGGFASMAQQYDVGIIFDEELGLFVIPFYGTFSKLFEVDDYKTISGYKECLNNFLRNNNIPHNIIYRLSKKYPNFMKVIDEILGTNYTLDELIQIYKFKYLESKIYSSTTVLYNSKLFNSTLSEIEEHADDEEPKEIPVVGRNDLCPCGSGKKYKKCCMNKN